MSILTKATVVSKAALGVFAHKKGSASVTVIDGRDFRLVR